MLKIQMLEQMFTENQDEMCDENANNFFSNQEKKTVQPQEIRKNHNHKGKRRENGKPEESREKISEKMFELLEKAQSSRLDDQRCRMPETTKGIQVLSMGRHSLPSTPHSPAHFFHSASNSTPKSSRSTAESCRRQLEAVLADHLHRGKELPMVVLPIDGGYWSEGEGQQQQEEQEEDEQTTARAYRRFFHQKEHMNLISTSQSLGPIILSIKPEKNQGNQQIRVILRSTSGTFHYLLPSFPCLTQLTQKHLENLENLENVEAITFPSSSSLILQYDERTLVNAYKFGVLLQKHGQTTEESLFSNETSKSFEVFLSLLGDKIQLRGHQGYKGGLDTVNGCTGENSVFTTFKNHEQTLEIEKNCEIMFHVSTFLPFGLNDAQQVQRKRHIGNDIVALVFQDEETPFSPSMIASHFLHCFIVVQLVKGKKGNDGELPRYRVSITARNDVPSFPPFLPSPPIFTHGPAFTNFLLAKLINAEIACYKAAKFAQLESRTRSSLLTTLTQDLRQKTQEFLSISCEKTEKTPTTPTKSFMDTVRKAWTSRLNASRNSSVKDPSPCSTRSFSSDLDLDSCSRSSSSLDLDADADSDTGMESMSSSGQKVQENPEVSAQVAQLKLDKLDLLRQNVICQREVKLLREKQSTLANDLHLANAEIRRLRELLLETK